MKKTVIIAAVIVSLLLTISVLVHANKKLRQERAAYRSNTEVLLSDLEHYKTKSGEDAVRVGELQLRVSELEKYRAEDAAIIKDMGVKNKELEQLTKVYQQTIYHLEGQAHDTVFIEVDTGEETAAQCAEYSDQWLDFLCCIYEDGSYKADVQTRDSIIYVEHVEYARALGFLWRTRRIKSREQSILNRNPNATIVGAEFITIRK